MTKQRLRKQRHGFTLVEVLVTIFVMAIGLLSLLALFPLGALTMAQAIKDDRTAHANQNANSIAKLWDIRHDTNVLNAMTTPAPVNTSGPSYPVFVDPQGFAVGSSWLYTQIVNNQNVGIPRIMPNFVQNPPAPFSPGYMMNRWFNLPDDITFGPDGIPNPNGNGVIERGDRYSWAYLCREPIYDPAPTATTAVELTTVVFDRRSNLLQSDLSLEGETAYTAIFTANNNVATLTWNAGTTPPPIRRGVWVLDATVTPEIHGYFYRVVGVVTPGSAGPNSVDLELQTNAQVGASPGVAVVMDSVAEVFPLGVGP